MARTQLTVHDATRTGLYLGTIGQAVAAANGAMYRNTGREWVRVSNTSGSPCTLTFSVPRTVDGQSVNATSYTVANNTYLYLPPFPVNDYNYPNEMVYITGTVALTITIFRDGT
jgi:hypothetical protein